MLKAMQVLGSCSGFISHRWKPNFDISAISILPSLQSPKIPCFRAFRVSSCRSESNPDGKSSTSTTSPSSSSSSIAIQSSGNTRNINFCQWCGGSTKYDIPDGEEKPRAVCTLCGKIAYQNPKMVVGCLIEHDNKILLCKRNIQPSYGLWTLPAGYMEIGESAAEGAIRETHEEAGAEVRVVSPFVQLDIPLIGQTYVIFLAKMKKAHFSPGPESSDCRLFALDEIPFDSLAFSSMVVTLNLYIEDRKAGRIKFHYGTINKSKVFELLGKFKSFLPRHIYREGNQIADFLASNSKLELNVNSFYTWFERLVKNNIASEGHVQFRMNQNASIIWFSYDTLSQALVQLDRKVESGLPDLNSRTKIFEICTQTMNCESNIQFKFLARLCQTSTDPARVLLTFTPIL